MKEFHKRSVSVSMEWVRRGIIGNGSFATVSLATARTCSNDAFPPLMAVKSTDCLRSASLQHEKRVLDNLGDCPQIVRCFGDDRTVENEGEMYNVFLEYASSGTLADRIRRSDSGGLPETDIRCYTRSVLKGIRHIHEKGFVHCDIKLENLLIFGKEEVKVSDFGLAKQRNVVRAETGEARVEIRGTPLHMAPESVNEGVYDCPADIWALGCCVVELSSGETAWSLEEGSNFMSLFARIGAGDEVPRIPADLSEEGKDFCHKCFAKDPRMRWTAEMLLDHPFVAVDQDRNNDAVASGCGEEEFSVSPKSAFDFPDWVSVQSPVNSTVSFRFSVDYPPSDPLSSSPPEERIRGLMTDETVDWSVSGSWFTVR